MLNFSTSQHSYLCSNFLVLDKLQSTILALLIGYTSAKLQSTISTWVQTGRLYQSLDVKIDMVGILFLFETNMAPFMPFRVILVIEWQHNTWTNMIVKMTILRLLGSSDDKENIGVARPEGPHLPIEPTLGKLNKSVQWTQKLRQGLYTG